MNDYHLTLRARNPGTVSGAQFIHSPYAGGCIVPFDVGAARAVAANPIPNNGEAVKVQRIMAAGVSSRTPGI